MKNIFISIFIFSFIGNADAFDYQENSDKDIVLSANFGYASFNMDGFNDYLNLIGNAYAITVDKLNDGLSISLNLKYNVMKELGFFLELSGGYIFGKSESKSSSLTVIDNAGNILGPDSFSFNHKVSSTPISLSGIYSLRKNNWGFDLGIGGGYYIGKVEREFVFQRFSQLNINQNWEGTDFGFHILGAAEYFLTQILSLKLGLIYRFVNIDELKDRDGDIVKFDSIFAGANQNNIELDFSGIEINGGVSLRF